MIRHRQAVILPVVLLVLTLLGLMGAMFAFRVNADLASTQVVSDRLQTRLAAEAGIERVKLLLRDSRFDIDRWYNNPEELHRVIVWVDGGNDSTWGSTEEFEGDEFGFRFSIVADDPTDDEDFIRFGITDEASKLNLNTATEAQLLKLVRHAVGDADDIDPQQIVNAILDWRDSDSAPRGDPGDTEGAYYRKLEKPYRVKNGPFDTVEELLLVKGVTGNVLYGEDFDRNGLLTPNEDDGDRSFPPDNEDNVLNPGLYPYLTVFSREHIVTNENRQRTHLFGNQALLQTELDLVFPDRPDVVQFILTAVKKPSGNPKKGGKKGGAANPKGESGGNPNDPPTEGGEAGNTDEPADPNAENDQPGTDNGGTGESTDGTKTQKPIATPASLLGERKEGENVVPSPLTMEDLPILMDALTVIPPKQRYIPGLINVNTAPRPVLNCIEGLSEEQVDAILEMRDRVGAEQKKTTAWLLAEAVLDFETYEKVAPQITARAQQLTIEALGYADHKGMVTRLQAIVEMTGPVAQTVYYRDITYLGGHFPIREEDLEQVRGR
jgi:type II secretory pathway component PulK